MFYHFEELPSTIDEARDGKYGHGDVVVAEHQTAGRGQRGKKWSSEAGTAKNKETRMKFKCRECNISLCYTPWFEVYHTKLHF